jgi:hypothetical protein
MNASCATAGDRGFPGPVSTNEHARSADWCAVVPNEGRNRSSRAASRRTSILPYWGERLGAEDRDQLARTATAVALPQSERSADLRVPSGSIQNGHALEALL